MHEIVTISGSPSLSSRCCAILKYAEKVCAKHGLEPAPITVRDLPSNDDVFTPFSLMFWCKKANPICFLEKTALSFQNNDNH